MNNTVRKQRELTHWKEWQDRADAVWGWRTPAGIRRADRRAKLFLELGRMDSDSTVLEVGCGTGEFTVRVAPCVKQLTATDLSPELLEHAREHLRQRCPTVHVRFGVQDAMKLSLEDETFDAVFGCSILHHVEPEPALREAHRVLKPGGWCAFSEPNMMNPQIALQKNIGFLKRRAGDSPDETAFFRGQLVELLRKTGFQDIEVYPFDFLHPHTPSSLIPFVEKAGQWLENIPILRAIGGSLMFCARKPGRSAEATHV